MFFTTLSIIIILCILIIGVLVFLKKPREKPDLSFLVLIFSIAFWLTSNTLIKIVSESYIVIILKFSFFTGAFVIFSLFVFSLKFPKKLLNKSKIVELIGFIPTVLISLLSLSNWLVKGFEKQNDIILPKYEKGFLLFFIFIIVYLTATFIILLLQYRTSKGILRQQIKFLFIGIILSVLLVLSTDFLAPILFKTSLLANFSPLNIIFLIVFATYAIFKHHLFDIKIIATELFALAIIIIFFIETFLTKLSIGFILRFFFFVMISFFSFFLIKSVFEEVYQRKEIEKLAKKLEKANLKLKELSEAKSTFVSIAAHQLKTPIASIKGRLSMLSDGDFGPIGNKQKNVVQKSLSSIQILINLIDVFLNVTKIEANKVEFIKENVQIEDLIQKSVDDLELIAKDKNLYLKFIRPEKPLPKIYIDSEKIKNVIYNLIDNAMKYTYAGGIKIYTKIDSRNIYVYTKDTGIGLAPEEKNIIFDKFVRAEGGLKMDKKGTGLGLFIIKSFIESHNGKVWAESEGKEKGSAFVFSLPYKNV